MAGQQNLRDGHAVLEEHLVVDVHEFALTDRSGSLFHAHITRAIDDAELVETDTDRTGRDQDKFKSSVVQIGDDAHQMFDAANVQFSVGIGQRRGADLEHQTARIGTSGHGKRLL